MHQQEQSETKLIAVRIRHLQFVFSIHTTLVVIHIVCVMCMRDEWCWTFKSCLGYCCLSISREGGSLTAKVTSIEPIHLHCTLCSEDLATVNVLEISEPLWGAEIISDTSTVVGNGRETTQDAPCAFQVFKMDSTEFFIKILVNLQLRNNCVLFWARPGLSVCLTIEQQSY